MRFRYLLAGGIALGIVVLDLFTKRLAALNFQDGYVEVIPGILGFTYHENPGAAFSLFSDGGSIIGLVVADRIFRGEGLLDGRVIDWIDLWWIPTFNVADMAVTLAVATLLVYAWVSR